MRAQYRCRAALPPDIYDTLLASCSRTFLAAALDGKDTDGQGHDSDILHVTALAVSQDKYYADRANTSGALLAINQKLLTHTPNDATPWPPLVRVPQPH